MNINPNAHFVPPAAPPATASPGSAPSALDLADLLAILRAGLGWIVGGLILGLFLGWFYTWGATPVYQSDAMVQVESDNSAKSVNVALGEMAEALSEKSPTGAEIEILRSRMVVGKVVQTLNLDIEASPHYFPLIGRPLARRHPPRAGLASPRFGLDAYAWGGERLDITTLDLPVDWRDRPLQLVAGAADQFELRFDGQVVLTGRTGVLNQRRDVASGERLAVFVRTLRARPGTRFDLVKLSRPRAIGDVMRVLSVAERGRQTGMIGLAYQDPAPVTAQQVLNQILNEYLRQNVERRSADAAQTLVFLQGQLPQLRGRVEAAENSLKNYQMRQGSADLPEETSQLLKQSVSLETLRLELVQRKQEALQRYTESHPTVRALDDQLVQVQGELGRIEGQTRSIPATQKELLGLKRDLEVNTALYTSLLNSYQQLQVAKAGTIGNARIIDYADVPIGPVRPNRPQILALAALLGLLAGVGAVFLARALRHGIEDPGVVERQLNLPTYAAIPFVRSQERVTHRMRRLRRDALPILAVAEPGNIAVESLRSLRTSLHFAMLEADNNIIMLTGPSPGLGKSFTSINLGAVLAMSDKSVVLVDADMRRGYLHEYVSRRRAPGLSEYIAQQADLDAILQATAAPGMKVVTTGELPPNPAELLLHPRFKALLDELARRFDYVLVDTAPVLAVTDASIVGALAGTTMLVLKAGEHDLRTIEESVRRLSQNGASVRGTIFNQMGRNGQVTKQGYQYGYQYDYKSHRPA